MAIPNALNTRHSELVSESVKAVSQKQTLMSNDDRLTQFLKMLNRVTKGTSEPNLSGMLKQVQHDNVGEDCDPVCEAQHDKNWFALSQVQGDKMRLAITYKKCAFTLAEVLLTIGILGVVSAMTIPTLMQRIDERETISRLQKFYSAMENAGRLAVAEYGTIDKWGLVGDLTSSQKVDIFWDRYSKYLKVQKIYKYDERPTNEDITPTFLGGGTAWDSLKRHFIILADGVMIRSSWASDAMIACYTTNNRPIESTCGEFSVDVNGDKGPNQVGKDIFIFSITRNGVRPHGSPLVNNSDYNRSFAGYCKKDDSNLSMNGYGCAAWILYKGNMDYLKCDDLTWDGKNKCN
ncbi:type II secretion system protein [bacterium]|nr:type II secretion system protein [bacterium]